MRGISQLQLSSRTGIPVRRLSYYERGLRQPPAHELRLIARQLGLEVAAAPEQRARILTNLENWDAVAPWCEQLGLGPLPREFREQVPCTPLQGLAWSQLAQQGARLCSASPTRLGFELHPLVDGNHGGLGHRPLPCLSWSGPEQSFVLWPQVRLRTRERSYLLEALVLAADWGACRWVGLKLDGETMDMDWDRRMREHLRLRLLRIEPESVWRGSFRECLEAWLSPAQAQQDEA
jgi:transcriptional regulator with XRE-family HTH domain